jgi:hypothetical protein
MRVSRIQFDDSEPTESIVSRIACAFDPGNILRVRGKFFKMSAQRVMNQTVESNVVGDNYTLILNPGELIPENLLKAAPPPVVVQKIESEEVDWDAEEPEKAEVDPEPVEEPITQEPIKVLVESEPLVEKDPLEIDSTAILPVATPEPAEAAVPLSESIQPTPPDSVPPDSQVFASRPTPSIDGKPLTVEGPTPTSESGEYRLELPKSRVRVEPGQVWQSKDTRRNSPPFVVKSVDNEFVYLDKGKRILLNRMIRYKRVS